MNFNALRRAQEKLRTASGANELGSLLWWQLSGNNINHEALVALAELHGLAAKILPRAIKPTQAFRRASRSAASRLPDGLMLRPITESSTEIVVGLVRERPNEARRDIDYDVICRIAFEKDRTAIIADAQHAVVQQIRDLYQQHLSHTTEDVRSMMVAFLSEAGVSLRDAGGVYFVAATHAPMLNALCNVVAEIGHNKTFVLPIVDTPATKATLRDVAERTLDVEIRELEAELADFDFEAVRDSTLERRLEAFERLRNRTGLFAGVLSFKVDTLNQRIGLMQRRIREHLGIPPVGSSEVATTATTSAPPRDENLTALDRDLGF